MRRIYMWMRRIYIYIYIYAYEVKCGYDRDKGEYERREEERELKELKYMMQELIVSCCGPAESCGKAGVVMAQNVQAMGMGSTEAKVKEMVMERQCADAHTREVEAKNQLAALKQRMRRESHSVKGWTKRANRIRKRSHSKLQQSFSCRLTYLDLE